MQILGEKPKLQCNEFNLGFAQAKENSKIVISSQSESFSERNLKEALQILGEKPKLQCNEFNLGFAQAKENSKIVISSQSESLVIGI